MVTSEVLEQRTRPIRMGFVVSVVVTASVPVLFVLYQSSQRWGRFGGPYTYGYWVLPAAGIVAVFVLLAMAAVAEGDPFWTRVGVGFAIGTLIGVALSFMATALYFKVQTDSYMINRHECGSRNMGGDASCHNRDNREQWEERWENN